MKARYCVRLPMIVLLVAISSPAWASITYDIQKPLDEYGRVDQNTAGIFGGANACGPTATINSFIYLQNHYGVDLNVDPDDPVKAVNELGWYMSLDPNNGVTDPNFISGKQTWLDLYGNGVYMLHQSTAVDRLVPNWQFIYDELAACEDVEVGFVWSTGGGHWVTATSFHFVDTNENGAIDGGETATIDFIDPGNPGVVTYANLSVDPGTYNYGGTNYSGFLDLTYQIAGSIGRIDIVVSESIPEPATVIIWTLLGGLGIVVSRRQWRRKVA